MADGSTEWAFLASSPDLSRCSGDAHWSVPGEKLLLGKCVVDSFSLVLHGSKLRLAEVDSVNAHIGGSVDSSTSGEVSMPIQEGGRNVGQAKVIGSANPTSLVRSAICEKVTPPVRGE